MPLLVLESVPVYLHVLPGCIPHRGKNVNYTVRSRYPK